MVESSLVDYLQRQAGEHHRGTFRYDGSDTDILHLRDDIERTLLTSQIDRLLRRLRPESSPNEERAFPFGELKATVRLFEEVTLLHFPRGENRGIVVSLEPEMAKDLNAFVRECEKRMRD